jgi:hypothetical protein
MKLKQIVISIENSAGRLYEVTKAMGDRGINLRALSLVDTGAFGQLRLLVSDVPKTRQILMEMNMPAFVNEVVAVEVEDAPGSLSKILEPLNKAKVSVAYMYAYGGANSGKAVMVFRFSDNDQAITLLQSHGHKILDADAFGILESAV